MRSELISYSLNRIAPVSMITSSISVKNVWDDKLSDTIGPAIWQFRDFTLLTTNVISNVHKKAIFEPKKSKIHCRGLL